MSKENYLNGKIGFLSGALSSGATTVLLASSTMFPSTGNFTVKCDSEIMLVTGNTSNTLTVVRGQEGTAAVAHSDTAPIFSVLTDGSLRRLVIHTANAGTPSARRQTNYVDGGGVAWTVADDATNDSTNVSAVVSGGGGSGQTYEPTWTVPVLTDYTWVNQGSATASDDGKGIFLTTPAATQNDMKLLVIATGSAPWSYVCKLIPSNFLPNAGSCGVVWCAGTAGGHQHTVRLLPNNTLDGVEWGSPTSYSGGDFSAIGIDNFRWIKVANNSTNIIVSVSVDGTNWIPVKSDYTTSYIGSAFDHVGFYVEGGTSVWPASVKCVSSKLN